MKICFFADARNVHVRRLTVGLASRGHQVHVVCHKPELHAWAAGVTAERFCVPSPGLTRPYGWLKRWANYLRGFLTAFDVVVVFFLHDWGFTPEMTRHGCLVLSPRGSDIVPPPGEGFPAEDLVARRIALMQNAAMVGVAGPGFARIVCEFAGLEEGSIGLLPLGVDLKKFRPAASGEGGGRATTVGFLKGFRPVYGAIDLVRAIPFVLREMPGAKFELVGDGPDLEKCQSLAGALGAAESIRWIPKRAHDDVPGLIKHWDLTVMPSHCESFGLAALESQAMCVPVVACDVGGVADVVKDMVTGRLVLPGNPEALARAIVEVLSDPSRRREMGVAGREFVAQYYGWERVLKEWEDTLIVARDRVSITV